MFGYPWRKVGLWKLFKAQNRRTEGLVTSIYQRKENKPKIVFLFYFESLLS